MGMYRNLHRTLLLKRKYTYLAHNIHRLQIRFSVMDKKSLIIDLASRPGGVDHETAAKLNRRVVWALGLPAKAAPMTAGEIIARTVTDILNERGTKNVT